MGALEMRWRDVDYLCHGLEVIVVYDDREGEIGRPAVTPKRVRGVIECEFEDDFPTLIASDKTVHAFSTAIVLLVPPRGV